MADHEKTTQATARIADRGAPTHRINHLFPRARARFMGAKHNMSAAHPSLLVCAESGGARGLPDNAYGWRLTGAAKRLAARGELRQIARSFLSPDRKQAVEHRDRPNGHIHETLQVRVKYR